MPLFTLIARDKPESFDLRAATRPAHLAWLGEHSGAVKLGGPWTDAEGRAIGSLLIIEAEDQAAVEALVAQDPYAKAGLFAHAAVEPWKLVVGGFGA